MTDSVDRPQSRLGKLVSPIRRLRVGSLPADAAAMVARQLLQFAAVLLAIVLFAHLGLGMARGDTFPVALSRAALDTVDYVARLSRGNLGRSTAAGITQASVPIAEVLPGLVAKSLGLLAASLALAGLVATPLGVWAASHRQSRWSIVTTLVSIVGVSIPSFFAALLLQLGAIRATKLFGHRVLPVGGFGWDRHLILPMLVLATRPIAHLYRVTQVTISDVLEQDYVRTARSKGIRRSLVMARHVIRNAAIPILTTLSMSLRFSLSSLPIVEFFFGWPGAGFTLLKSISQGEDDLTVALLLALGTLFVLVNIGLDGAYRCIDPRLRMPHDSWRNTLRWNVVDELRSVAADLACLFRDNPLRRLVGMRQRKDSPAKPLLETRGEVMDGLPARYRAERIRSWLRATVRNIPFVVGAALVGVLLVVFLMGPWLAPHSPYSTKGLTYDGGELAMPPFEPGGEHPWGTDVLGRDILSLVLAGAQQTLLLATLAVAARVGVGLLFGAIAGWCSGSWIDGAIMGLSETMAAFPTLLLAMTFVLALGIRQGFRPFVIALCLVGWGEVMQFVRGEVMSIRPKLYIQSAIAVGLTLPRLIVSHVLPNLLSALISMTALEMGAVLMLLGELGFVGIFIGGGAFADLQWMAPPYHYSDVPEWGALLSNVRRYARSYPWMAVYPSLAFFVAILGFNLFGEGVRRLMEQVGFGLTRLVNRYTVGLVLITVVVGGWVRTHSGPAAFYVQQAASFEGERAASHVKALALPVFQTCALGTTGMYAASYHIAEQFADVGLQPAGEEMTFFQYRTRSFSTLDRPPRLEIQGQQRRFVYGEDFTEFPSFMQNEGKAQGEVRAVALGELRTSGARFSTYGALDSLDVAGDVLLVPSPDDAELLQSIRCAGMLVLADDPAQLSRRTTLSSRRRSWSRPMLWISRGTADAILEASSLSTGELENRVDRLGVDEVLNIGTGTDAAVTVDASRHEGVQVRHVLGHLPGEAARIEGAPRADAAKLDHELIVVMAQYDAPPARPSGTSSHLAAGDQASGVGVMLEVARAMQTSGYEPYRSFLFVAYSGEGLEGGERVDPIKDVERFLGAKTGFLDNFEIEGAIILRGHGKGDGGPLLISGGGSTRLAGLMERAARQTGMEARRTGTPVDLGVVFEEGEELVGQEVPHVTVSWGESQVISSTPGDLAQQVSATQLEKVGRTLSLALMIIGRERDY